MNDPTKVFNTHTLDVKWSHLHRPDDKFGAPGNHNVSVVVDDQLQTQLSEIQIGAARDLYLQLLAFD